MEQISDYLTQQMIRRGMIEQEDRDIYEFGIECLILKVIHYSSYFIIALLTNSLWQFLVLICAFLPLRKSAGGYHARTRIGCYLFSCSFVLLLQEISIHMPNSLWLFFASAIACVYLWWRAPIDSPNKPMDEKERSCYQAKTRKNLIAMGSIITLLCIFSLWELISLLLIGMIAASVLVLLGEIQSKKMVNEFQ